MVGWTRIHFNDDDGMEECGLWYAPVALKEAITHPPNSFEGIQNVARMSAMAILLWFALGEGHPNANKYCVITNWWKERNHEGIYMHPSLDFAHYQDSGKQLNNVTG